MASGQAVLLVNDSADTLEMYAVGLSLAGYHPLLAPDIDTALGQLKKGLPDAVVTDVQLVGARDGWELIREIRNDPSTNQTPVVVLTGATDPSIAVNAQRVGCAAVLTKPCLPAELAHVLQRVLRATPERTR